MAILQNVINQWCIDEDAIVLEKITPEISQLLYADDLEEECENTTIEKIARISNNLIEIRWRGLGVRRGVMFLSNEPKKTHIGFTTAGNGTPAYIFPNNNWITETLYWEILSKTLL